MSSRLTVDFLIFPTMVFLMRDRNHHFRNTWPLTTEQNFSLTQSENICRQQFHGGSNGEISEIGSKWPTSKTAHLMDSELAHFGNIVYFYFIQFQSVFIDWLIGWCFTLLSTIFQSYHGDSSNNSCLSWVSPVLGWGSEVSEPCRTPQFSLVCF